MEEIIFQVVSDVLCLDFNIIKYSTMSFQYLKGAYKKKGAKLNFYRQIETGQEGMILK